MHTGMWVDHFHFHQTMWHPNLPYGYVPWYLWNVPLMFLSRVWWIDAMLMPWTNVHTSFRRLFKYYVCCFCARKIQDVSCLQLQYILVCVSAYLCVTDSAVNESVSRGNGDCAPIWSVSLWKLCSAGTREVIFRWQWWLLTVKCLQYSKVQVSTHSLRKRSSQWAAFS